MEIAGTLALLGVGIFSGVVFGFTASLRFRFSLLAFLSVVLIFLPGAPDSLPLYLLFAILSGAREVLRFDLWWWLPKLLSTIAGVGAAATFWSPLPSVGWAWVAQVLVLVVVALQGKALALKGGIPRTAVDILAWSISLQAVLVIIFRLVPEIEDIFLRSPIAPLLVGGDRAERLFTTSPDNVLDPAKAGGFFLNANTASMYLGVAACLFLAYAAMTGRARYRWVSVLCLVSVVATGSKSGLILLILPALAWVCVRMRSRVGRMFAPVIIVAAALFALLSPILISAIDTQFASDVETTVGTRQLIWSAGAQLFAASPVLGLGFGGWGIEFARFAGPDLAARYPPHNTIIQTWADTGFLGAFILAGLYVLILTRGMKATFQSPSSQTARVRAYSVFGVLWMICHGMGDAMPFFGDNRTGFLFVLLVVFMVFGKGHTGVNPPEEGRLVVQRKESAVVAHKVGRLRTTSRASSK